ncbi:12336_t:CDS:2 [Dentiscutata erythropus]|uniref:12336_t:CDS:1 n=1 Tax=Dentiscutata erythropus TaxID=1348616 RepID=A0A9N9NTM1_9GLOM|nr:12336_t:CDS:2 [Dentiscutata erythropus]
MHWNEQAYDLNVMNNVTEQTNSIISERLDQSPYNVTTCIQNSDSQRLDQLRNTRDQPENNADILGELNQDIHEQPQSNADTLNELDQDALHRDFTVCHNKVAQALYWLKSNNRYYAEITIDSEIL